MNFKLRIVLENKNTNEITAIHPTIYDEENGLMNFPVDLNRWNVLRVDRCSEIRDNEENMIFEGDELVDRNEGKHIVSFYNGAFRIGEIILNEETVQYLQLRKINTNRKI